MILQNVFILDQALSLKEILSQYICGTDKELLIATYLRSRKPNTIKAYGGAIKRWQVYCTDNCIPIVPSNTHVAAFFANLIDQNVSLSTFECNFAALSWFFQILDTHNNPCTSFCVKSMEQAARRVLPTGENKNSPLSIENVQCVVALLLGKSDFASLRLAVMCCLGFYGFMRIEEILSLNIEDVEFDTTKCVQYIQLRLKNAKTDVFRKGQYVYIAARADKLCPLKVLWLYLKGRGRYVQSSFAPLFFNLRKAKHGLTSSGKPFSYSRARACLKQILGEAGITGTRLGWHSLRSGGVHMGSKKWGALGPSPKARKMENFREHDTLCATVFGYVIVCYFCSVMFLS